MTTVHYFCYLLFLIITKYRYEFTDNDTLFYTNKQYCLLPPPQQLNGCKQLFHMTASQEKIIILKMSFLWFFCPYNIRLHYYLSWTSVIWYGSCLHIVQYDVRICDESRYPPPKWGFRAIFHDLLNFKFGKSTEYKFLLKYLDFG